MAVSCMFTVCVFRCVSSGHEVLRSDEDDSCVCKY